MTYHVDERNHSFHNQTGQQPKIPADVRYYTTRPFRVAMATQILPMLMMLPFIILSPEMGVVVAATALAMAWWTQASFRFELTARDMRVRSQPFGPLTTVPLDEAGRPLSWGRNAAVGHLRFKLRDGEEMYVVGLADPLESADAVRTLQREAEQGVV